MLEEMTVDVLAQIIVGVATVTGVFVTMRMQSSSNAQALGDLKKRVDEAEKSYATMLSRREAEDHYVTKLQFELTLKNMSQQLKHIEENQERMFRILENQKKER